MSPSSNNALGVSLCAIAILACARDPSTRSVTLTEGSAIDRPTDSPTSPNPAVSRAPAHEMQLVASGRLDSALSTDSSPFGISTSHSSSTDIAAWLPDVRAAGVTWLRGFDISQAEASMSTARRLGVNLAGFLMWSPKGQKLSLPTNHLEEWSQYVTRLVRRCKGQVNFWEVWNEPPNATEDKSPESYAKIVRVAYEAAKAVDPSVQIGLAAQSNHVHWLESTIEAGAKDHFDYVTFHPYEVLDAANEGAESLFLHIVPTLRAMLRTRNPARANVPIWFTEIGEPVTKVTPEHQAGSVIKAYTLSLAQGVHRIHWFEGKDGDSGPFGLIDAKGGHRNAYVALTALIEYISTTPRYLGWVLLPQSNYGFVFAHQQSVVMISWSRSVVEPMLEFDSTVEVLDPVSGKRTLSQQVILTHSPLIMRGLSSDWSQRAQANVSKPLPWDGDFSLARTISLNAPDDQRGLHQFGRPKLRSFGGEMARDASGASMQTFAIDPNFAGYRAEPLRITVILRRNGSESAGFNLRYESTSGWKSVGQWFTVPEGNDFTTKEFVITDGSFVGKWGYHFAFDSDSQKHSAYSVKRIEISKLSTESAQAL